MTDFSRLKKQLNKQQLEAVENIEGPVMVLAGPGTGKTQVVAMRIAEILKRTQVSPKNILALTFTEAGVTALRARLESIIGPEAYQVTVATFHSFSNEIIQTFPYLFGFDESLHQISELERLQLIEKIVLDSPDLARLKPLKKPTTHIKAIADNIRTCKQEATTPEGLQKLANDQLKNLEDAKLTAAEREKQTVFAERNLELSQIYRIYEQQLQETERYDYEDMILKAVEALQNNDELRAHYQEKYQYLLVDEYQDTNNGQNSLVEALASFFENPNLFVVGDDKQAIYRFQGASVANMLHFTKSYPDIKIISLGENYRSTPEILASASKLIANNPHQLSSYLKIDGKLTAVKPSSNKPRIIESPTPLAEFAAIVEQIKTLKKDGCKDNQIAVLFRLNADANNFRDFAGKSGILTAGKITVDVTSEPVIKALLTVLRSVDNPQSNLVTLPALTLMVSAPGLVDVLELSPKSSLVKQAAASKTKKLSEAVKLLLELHQASRKLSLMFLFEKILAETVIISRVMSKENQLEELDIINAFAQEIKRFAQSNPKAKLREFLKYIDALISYKVQIPVNRAISEKDGVFVGTVHSVKGLEFEAVIMSKVNDKTWSGRKSHNVIQLPAAIIDLKNWNDEPLEDDRRLFYVGLTRAKQQLILSYSSTKDDGTEVLPCQFISELEETIVRQTFQPSAKQIKETLSAGLLPTSEKIMSQQELSFVREKISNIALSYTSYKTYKHCPRQFLLRTVFGLQDEPTIPLVYGNITHKALELFFRAYKASHQLPSRQELLDYVALSYKKQPEVEDGAKLLAQAQDVIGAYFDKFAQSWQIPAGVEYGLWSHQIHLGEIKLTGKFDRIDVVDPKSRSVRIVDYKTVSRLPSRNEIEGGTKNSDGDLKTQLVFYAMLAKNDPLFPYRATDFRLSFLDGGKKFKEEDFKISSSEITALEKDLQKVYSEMLTIENFQHTRSDFDRGCEICASFPGLN